MKDKTYPAICRAVDGKEYLYANKNNYYSYQCSAWDKSDSSDNHENDTNITREYLEGKCVKIESPEHSEFVQKLAFNAGFKWATSFGSVKHTDKKLLIFKSSGSINFGNCADYDDIQITIPLPPKAGDSDFSEGGAIGPFKNIEPDSIEKMHFNVEIGEPKEWPQVGDEVLFRNDLCKVLLEEDASRHIVVEWNGNYVNPHIGDIKKPKTEAEILRDDLWEAVLCKVNKGVNKDELISDLLDRYNITKKPQ